MDSRKLSKLLQINGEIERFRMLFLWNHDLILIREHYNLLGHRYNTVHTLLTKKKPDIIISPYHFSHNSRYCTAIIIKGNDYVFARLAGNDMYDTEISSSLYVLLILENHCSFRNLKRNKVQSKLMCISFCLS